jgi:hypothetical protein
VVDRKCWKRLSKPTLNAVDRELIIHNILHESIILMAGMQLIPLLQEQREFRMPEINQIVVNRDFIGLGKELEEKRRERRIADEQSRSLESHVQSLEREHKKTVKEINRKHRLMQDMLELRQRQDE